MSRNLAQLTIKNKNYRKVIQTTKTLQLVLMTLLPGEDIPKEIHKDKTQFIRVEKGKAFVKIGSQEYHLKDDDFIIIPPGKKHYVSNEGSTNLSLYSIYSPPEHPPKRLNKRQPKKLS